MQYDFPNKWKSSIQTHTLYIEGKKNISLHKLYHKLNSNV